MGGMRLLQPDSVSLRVRVYTEANERYLKPPITAVVKNLATRLEIQKEGNCDAETISESTEGVIAIEEMLQSMADHYAVRPRLEPSRTFF